MKLWVHDVPPVSEGHINSLSFYRGARPWKLIEDSLIKVDIARQDHWVHWSSMTGYDAVFFQKPFTPNENSAIRYCKRMGIKVILDYDDNIFNMPRWNDASNIYKHRSVIDCVKSCCELADVVITSTPALDDVFYPHCRKTKIIPIAMDDYLFKKEPKPERSKIIAWRGANGHEGDVWFNRDEFKRLLDENPGHKVRFYGQYFTWMHDILQDKFEYQEPLETIDYIDKLWEDAPAMLYIPLIETPFNICKSNVALLEGTYAGARVIAPEWMDKRYRKLSVVNEMRKELIRSL